MKLLASLSISSVIWMNLAIKSLSDDIDLSHFEINADFLDLSALDADNMKESGLVNLKDRNKVEFYRSAENNSTPKSNDMAYKKIKFIDDSKFENLVLNDKHKEFAAGIASYGEQNQVASFSQITTWNEKIEEIYNSTVYIPVDSYSQIENITKHLENMGFNQANIQSKIKNGNGTIRFTAKESDVTIEEIAILGKYIENEKVGFFSLINSQEIKEIFELKYGMLFLSQDGKCDHLVSRRIGQKFKVKNTRIIRGKLCEFEFPLAVRSPNVDDNIYGGRFNLSVHLGVEPDQSGSMRGEIAVFTAKSIQYFGKEKGRPNPATKPEHKNFVHDFFALLYESYSKYAESRNIIVVKP